MVDEGTPVLTSAAGVSRSGRLPRSGTRDDQIPCIGHWMPERTFPLHLLIMGPQGSGKGTQAALLAPALRLHHLSTGELFRAAISSGSPLGKAIQEIYDRGDLVTDELTCDLVAERLEAIAAGSARAGSGVVPDDAPTATGALFDGFPRTQPQADALDALLAGRGEAINAVIEITAPEEQLVQRLMLRGRTDDSEQGIRQRLADYHAKTAPLLERYRELGLVVSVDGARAIETVHEDLVARLRAFLGDGAHAG